MKIYTSCFVGVLLPDAWLVQYRQVQAEALRLVPSLELANDRTPHLTLYYLESQKQEALAEIVERVVVYKGLLSGVELRVRGMAVFQPEEPKVVVLKMDVDPAMEAFHRVMAEELHTYRNMEDRPFAPHITLGRLRSAMARAEYAQIEQQVREVCNGVDWGWRVEEVVVCGVDEDSDEVGMQVLERIRV